MAEQEVPDELERLVEKMNDEYLDSEVAIADALAAAEGPLDVDALVDETGYTKRTVQKRIDSLEDRLGGAPLLRRAGEDTFELHERLGLALRNRG